MEERKPHGKTLATEGQQEHLGSSTQQERITNLDGRKMHLETGSISETNRKCFMNRQDCATVLQKILKGHFFLTKCSKSHFIILFTLKCSGIWQRGTPTAFSYLEFWEVIFGIMSILFFNIKFKTLITVPILKFPSHQAIKDVFK